MHKNKGCGTPLVVAAVSAAARLMLASTTTGGRGGFPLHSLGGVGLLVWLQQTVRQWNNEQDADCHHRGRRDLWHDLRRTCLVQH